MMRSSLAATMGVLLLASLFPQSLASRQRPPASAQTATMTSMLDTELSIVEREFVGVADAMPEDKYSFAPTNGNFQGVRTFAQQVKHVAAANRDFFGGILGHPLANRAERENGPAFIRTKAQIMQYLRDSFALGHQAIATINAENAFTPMKSPPFPFIKTSSALVIFDMAHVMNHYGQLVEYLRDNGIVPPASRNRPPANPPR
jgi:uncharacterized damage-inducible protein DinB